MRALTLVVALVSAVAAPAAAEPMHTTLDELLKQSPTIVIATTGATAGPPHKATSYTLSVERVLRGSAKPGALVVKPSPMGHSYHPAGTRLVAFVSGAGEWLGYAAPIKGQPTPSLEGSALRLAGFYDFNASLVSPGVATLEGLEALVTKGTPLAWTFRGPVLVATPAGLAPSKIEVTATAPAGKVTGLPKLAGFDTPTVGVGSWEERDVVIEYQRNLARPFVLAGAVTGKHADGSIAVEYRLEYPGHLTERDLRTYLGNSRLGHPYYELELEVGGKKLPVVLGKETGRIGTLGGEEISSTSLEPQRFVKTATATVELAGKTRKRRARGTTPGLVDELMGGEIACTYKTAAGDLPCSLRYLRTRFAPR